MSKTKQLHLRDLSLIQWIAYLLVGSTTLVITINSYDSGIAKTPLLVLSSCLLGASFLAKTIWQGKLEFRRSPADIQVLLLLILILVSALYSNHQWSSGQALEVWIPFLTCFFAGSQLFSASSDINKLIRALALITTVVCAVGILQFFFAEQLSLNFFIGKERRVTSTLTNATYLSGYVILVFPALLASAINTKARTWKRWALVSLLIALAFLLFVTSTRSSIVAFFISLTVFVVLSRHTKKQIVLLGVACFVLAILAIYFSPRLMERIEASFEADASSSFARRLYFWEAGYKATIASPIFGHGIGTFSEVMAEYRSPDYWIVRSEDVVPHAHNELIETAVDLGGSGVVLYVLIIVTALASGFRSRLKENQPDRLMKLGIAASIVAVILDNMASMSLRVIPVGALTWLFLGILSSQSSARTIEWGIKVRTPKWLWVFPLLGWVVFTVWYVAGEVNVFRSDRHVITALMAAQSGDLPAAIREYNSAATLDRHNLLARSNLALSLLTAGRYEEALETVEGLHLLSPNYPKSNLAQAAALVALKRFQDALQPIEKEIAQCSHPAAYLYQAVAYMGLADSVAELAALEMLLLANIKGHIDYEIRFASALSMQLLRTEKDISTFRELYKQLAFQFPSNGIISATLARLDSTLEGIRKETLVPPSTTGNR